jgi:hypothetical protein
MTRWPLVLRAFGPRPLYHHRPFSLPVVRKQSQPARCPWSGRRLPTASVYWPGGEAEGLAHAEIAGCREPVLFARLVPWSQWFGKTLLNDRFLPSQVIHKSWHACS